jgi:hypothetical protein
MSKLYRFKSGKLIWGCLLSALLNVIPLLSYASTASSVTLKWDPNSEPDLAGYNIYYGTEPGIYGTPINVGKNTQYQFPNLESNQTHYFSVTAYNTAGQESTPSIEVSKFLGTSSHTP